MSRFDFAIVTPLCCRECLRAGKLNELVYSASRLQWLCPVNPKHQPVNDEDLYIESLVSP